MAPAGASTFTSFTPNFASSNWIVGENALIRAVRNISGGDQGGFSFGMQVDATATPEPASALTAGAVIAAMLVVRRRRRSHLASQR